MHITRDYLLFNNKGEGFIGALIGWLVNYQRNSEIRTVKISDSLMLLFILVLYSGYGCAAKKCPYVCSGKVNEL